VNSHLQNGFIDSLETCKLLFNEHIDSESAGILLRARLQATGRRLGFSDSQREQMALVAAEMASNQVKYAKGRGMIQIWQQPGGMLDLFALDYGPGIADLFHAQRDGFSTGQTLGKGLGSIQRLAIESGIYTRIADSSNSSWHGTAIWARFSPTHKTDTVADVEVGLFSRALSDDRFNGDRIYLAWKGCHKLRWLHLDGLGHGEGAQQATSNLGGHVAYSDNLISLLPTLDRELCGGRGAVAIMAELDWESRQLEIMGVGDMHAHLYQNETLQNISFAPGILGREHKTSTSSSYTLGESCVVETASDGIRRGTPDKSFPGLFQLHPQLIAYVLGNIMGRAADDQSLCIIRMS
jgi:anti-sigma regulatory factor (Ser/Thr protein kinase)